MSNDPNLNAPPRKTKRFQTEPEIIKAIDLCKKRRTDRMIKSMTEYQKADDLMRQTGDKPSPELAHTIKFHRLKGDNFCAAVTRFDRKLDRLKQTLAAFQTFTLPGITSDKSVVLEKLK